MRGPRSAIVVGIVALSVAVAASGCSDNSEGECEDDSSCATFIPAEVQAEIPEGSFISSNTTADFNDDGEDDYVVGYGPIVGTQLGLVTYVDGQLVTFTDPVGILFKLEKANSDSIDDLGLWYGNPATWHMTWADGGWIDADTFDPNDHGPG